MVLPIIKPFCRVIIVIVVAVSMSGCSGGSQKPPLANKGRIDLTGWDFERNGMIALDGEWEFYWNKLLSPDDFKAEVLPEKTGYFKIPGHWTGLESNGTKPFKDGYATFRPLIKQSVDPDIVMALRTKGMVHSSKVWINNQPFNWNGVVGQNRKTSIPSRCVQVSAFNPINGFNEVILQVSSFDEPLPGPANKIYLGNKEKITQKNTIGWSIDIFLVGSLCIMGFYHFALYVLRPKNLSAAYFCVVCLMWGVRFFVEGSDGYFITMLYPSLSYEIHTKLDLLPWYSVVPFTLMFIYSLFPEQGSFKLVRISQALGIIFSAIVIVAPYRVFVHTILYYEIISLITALYCCTITIRAALKKKDGALLIVSGILILTITAINDLLAAQNIIYSLYLLHFGMFCFILFQSFALSSRFAKAFVAEERLAENLEQLTKELENKNRDLTRLDSLKDDFLANTSHELKTPLFGIIGICESLINGVYGKLPDRASDRLSMVESSARRLSNLVNDILDFSRLKNRDIKLDLKPVNIRQIARNVISVSHPLTRGKSLELVNEISKKIPLVNGDEDRIQQIFFNLIGNAVKFTQKGSVRIGASVNNTHVIITVADTGVGIPEDSFSIVFESRRGREEYF